MSNAQDKIRILPPLALFAGLVFAVVGFLHASPVEAEEYDPTNTEELIEAMNDANANGEVDTINLVPGATYTLTEAVETDPDDIENLAGPTGLPPIIARQGLTNNEIVINGNGATIERSSAEGTPEFRIFATTRRSVDFPVPSLTIRDLTIRGGSSVEGKNSVNDGGGAVLNFNGTLSITGSTITDNTSAQYGGGVISSTSTVSNGGSTTIVNSTISGNSAELSGGGMHNTGGITEISYSTITDNSITGNGTDLEGGGVGTRGFFSGSETTRLTASIIVGNTSTGAEGEQPDDVGSITENFGFQSGGYNMVGETNRAQNFNQPGDATDAEIIDAFGTYFPRLQDNGGPTQTFSLRSGSEAINRVAADDFPATDQRGFVRPAARTTPDSGAFEFRAEPPAPKASVSPTSLDFGSIDAFTTSEPQTATLTNSGTAPLEVQSSSISGEDARQFEIESNTCEAATLEPDEECEISVVFSPNNKEGERSAELEVQTSARERPVVVDLTGTGIPVKPLPPGSACTITGTPGNDMLRGTPGRDVICGLEGNDTIYGLGGADLIRGGSGNNVIYGGADDDRIIGGSATDRILGQGGNDAVFADGGNDAIRGGNGNDIIFGQAGKDIVRGEGGDDRLYGGPDNDVLIGGPGKDALNGGSGRNILQQ